MPHRTVFQWGKNHAHPFTMFLGGLVIGALVTAAAGYAWVMADQTNPDFENVVTGKKTVQTANPSASPAAKVSPTPSYNAQF
jgi:hypothetical protein